MLKKISDLFAGPAMTTFSGGFLVLSLIFMLTGKELLFNPAWITIVLSGYPLTYLAITRLVYEKWISSALLISIAMAASIAIGELFAAGEVAFIMGNLRKKETIYLHAILPNLMENKKECRRISFRFLPSMHHLISVINQDVLQQLT